jgi:hypothetical protein
VHQELYRNILDEKRIAYTIVAGSLELRAQQALTLLI